jgi:hypothetical protein
VTRGYDREADYDSGVAVDPSGVYVEGETKGAFPGFTKVGGTDSFIRKYDSDGSLLWTRQFQQPRQFMGNGGCHWGERPVRRSDHRWRLPGFTLAGTTDGYVRHFDPNGNVLWTGQFGSPGRDSDGDNQGTGGRHLSDFRLSLALLLSTTALSPGRVALHVYHGSR